MKSRYRIVKVAAWDEAVHLRRHLGSGWIYRGQENPSWSLSTSLERAREYLRADPADLPAAELAMVEEFRRRAKNHLSVTPGDEPFEWLAMMQHHGAATRLLDFTRSFYVAAFFATERAVAESSIWTLNWRVLLGRVYEAVRPDGDFDTEFRDEDPMVAYKIERWLREAAREFVFTTRPVQMVFPIDTGWRPPRLDAQQGLFVIPTDLSTPFLANLSAGLSIPASDIREPETISYSSDESEWKKTWPTIDDSALLRIDLASDVPAAAMRDLWAMNLHAGTLFPGFDGFARSLNHYARGSSLAREEVRRVFRGLFASEGLGVKAS